MCRHRVGHGRAHERRYLVRDSRHVRVRQPHRLEQHAVRADHDDRALDLDIGRCEALARHDRPELADEMSAGGIARAAAQELRQEGRFGDHRDALDLLREERCQACIERRLRGAGRLLGRHVRRRRGQGQGGQTWRGELEELLERRALGGVQGPPGDGQQMIPVLHRADDAGRADDRLVTRDGPRWPIEVRLVEGAVERTRLVCGDEVATAAVRGIPGALAETPIRGITTDTRVHLHLERGLDLLGRQGLAQWTWGRAGVLGMDGRADRKAEQHGTHARGACCGQTLGSHGTPPVRRSHAQSRAIGQLPTTVWSRAGTAYSVRSATQGVMGSSLRPIPEQAGGPGPCPWDPGLDMSGRRSPPSHHMAAPSCTAPDLTAPTRWSWVVGAGAARHRWTDEGPPDAPAPERTFVSSTPPGREGRQASTSQECLDGRCLRMTGGTATGSAALRRHHSGGPATRASWRGRPRGVAVHHRSSPRPERPLPTRRRRSPCRHRQGRRPGRRP